MLVKNSKAVISFLITLLLPIFIFAGESGFISNGKTFVIYKDGEKIGKTPEELGIGIGKKESSRNIASFSKDGKYSDGGTILYQSDGNGNTCFYFSESTVPSCVRK